MTGLHTGLQECYGDKRPHAELRCASAEAGQNRRREPRRPSMDGRAVWGLWRLRVGGSRFQAASSFSF